MLQAGPGAVVATEKYALAGHELARRIDCTAVGDRWARKGVPVLRLLPRRSNDVTYFTNDAAHELDGLRDAGPGWWLRGDGDTRDPQNVSRALVTSDRAAIVGYDIVIAAPRPISVLLAVDPAHAAGVVDAHRASVRSTMEYLEERALVVRDRRGGLEREHSASWERVVSFTHGLNRHGEPHLHDHVLVGARPEGERNVLDCSRPLRARACRRRALSGVTASRACRANAVDGLAQL